MAYDAIGRTTSVSFSNDPAATPNRSYAYDADGRTVAATSTLFGTESRGYDANGNLTSVVEPTGNGYQAPATISYHYYPDNQRQALDISSSAISQSNAITYSYRPDGARQTEGFAGWGKSGNLRWTYTNAGRELTESDPYTGTSIPTYDVNGSPLGSQSLVARQQSYDAYGRVSGVTLPEAYTYSSFTYDSEDEQTGYSRSATSVKTETYSIRGELIYDKDTPLRNCGCSPASSANGFLTNLGGSFDARSNMLLSKGGSAVAYDGSGREVSSVTGSLYQGGATITRSYDAENHIHSQAYSTSVPCPGDYCGFYGYENSFFGPGTLTYNWGPTGHLLQATSGAGVSSLHWDGDALLVECQGNNCDLQVEGLAIITNGGSVNILDRDMNDEMVSWHGPTQFGAWTAIKAFSTAKLQGSAAPGSDPSNVYSGGQAYHQFIDVRPDGYSDGSGNTFQGVRVYDGALQQWTAPDAYSGEEHDPMSQKPFMWNHNNPIGYADPSGYEGSCPGCQGQDSSTTLREVPVPDWLKAEVKQVKQDEQAAAQAFNDFGAVGRAMVLGPPDLKPVRPSTLSPGPNAGEGVPGARGVRPSASQQREINAQGASRGCHTCGASTPGTRSGNWVGDHQPASKLNPGNAPTRLYPHCIRCSSAQGGHVRAIIRQGKP